MATTYTILVQDTEGEFVARDVPGTKSVKQKALDAATTIRRDEKRATRVVTGTGTVVLELKARKPQKKTKPYTRVVALPEGFQIPENERPAYDRKRKGAVITHDDEGVYRVRALEGAVVWFVGETTRQCGRFLADSVVVNDEGVATVTA